MNQSNFLLYQLFLLFSGISLLVAMLHHVQCQASPWENFSTLLPYIYTHDSLRPNSCLIALFRNTHKQAPENPA